MDGKNDKQCATRCGDFGWREDRSKNILSYKQETLNDILVEGFFCDPGRTRTFGPLIKSQMLYQLSYGIAFRKRDYKNTATFPYFQVKNALP